MSGSRIPKIPTRREQMEDEAEEKGEEVSEASDNFKMAVQAALVLGVPAEQVAQQYGLVVSEVRQWAQAFDITNPLKRRDTLSEKLLSFVEQELVALTAISMVTTDAAWIKRQNAADLALFVGAKQDRLMEILAAYGRTQESRQQIINAQNDD